MITQKRVALNVFAQLIGKSLTAATTFLITALITRKLGEAGYGEFTLIMAFPALFYIISDFGLNAIVARELAGEEVKTKKYLQALVTLRLLIATLLVLIALIALSFLPYSSIIKMGIVIALLTIFTQALYTTANVIFQVNLRYDLSVIASTFSSLVVVILVILIAQRISDNSLLLLVGSYVVGGILMVAISFALTQRLGGRIGLSFNVQLMKNLFLASLPLGLTIVFGQINTKADIFLISLLQLPHSYGLTTEETMGVYGLGYKVFEVILVFPTFFMNAVYPVMIRHKKESMEKLKSTFIKSTSILFGLGVLSAIFSFILAPFIIMIVGGKGFDQSIMALRLLSLGLPVFFLTAPIQWYLISLDKQRILPLIYLTGAVFNVLFNLILIPKFSYQASAVLTWGSEIVILLFLIRYCFKFWPREQKLDFRLYNS